MYCIGTSILDGTASVLISTDPGRTDYASPVASPSNVCCCVDDAACLLANLIDYPLILLVLRSPLWSLILTGVLQLVTFLFGLVDGSLRVLSRSINGEQAKRGRASVDDYSSASIR